MGEFVHDPVIGQRYRFTRAGDVLRVEVTAEPGSEVPEHVHPRTEERLEIFEGKWGLRLDGEDRRAGPGDRLVIPAGTRHRLANVGSGVGRLVAEIEPALDIEDLFRRSAALGRAGAFRRPGVPSGLRGALAAAELAERHRDAMVVSFPPPSVQRLLFPLLARIERWRRRRGTR